MIRRLVVIDGADQGQFLVLPEAGTVLVGSNRRHCDFCLHDLYVARSHFEVATAGGIPAELVARESFGPDFDRVGYSHRVVDALKRHEVDVLFGSCLLARYPTVATLSWIPDFQHVHLPSLFSEQERADRDASHVAVE